MKTRSEKRLLIVALVLASLPLVAWGQAPQAAPAAKPEPAKAEPAKDAVAAAAPQPADDIALRQGQVSDKYGRLEKLMLRLAELDSASNPRRAALLKQAVAQAKDQHIQLQLETIVKLLGNEGPSRRVIENQSEVHTDLKALLELLLKEDRSDRIKDEKARIREYIKEVERRLREESSLQGRTEGGDDTQRLAGEQGKVADRTGELAKRMAENEEAGKSKDGDPKEGKPSDGKPNEGKPSEGKPNDGKPNDGKPSEGKPSDGKPSEGKPSEGKPSEGKPSEGKPGEKPDAKPGEKPDDKKPGENKPGENKPGEKKPGENKPSEGKPSEGKPSEGKPSEGKPSEGKPSEGKPSEGKPSEGKPSEGQEGDSQSSPPSPQQEKDDGYPPRKRIQEAEEKMRKAQQKLEEAKRKEAQEEQELARQELQKAKAELEQILRQLREEEVERTLAMLEGRFRKMLEMQLKVYEDTKRLEKVPVATRPQTDFERDAVRLSFEERKIVVEADKALTLLQEEGSSLAFPEIVDSMRQDMEKVTERLGQGRTDRITQGLEEDVIAALTEMIDALQKAQKDQEQRKKQQQPGQPGEPQEQPLVDKIAELKAIRSLQIRVNNRTTRYSKLLEHPDEFHGQATDAELAKAIQELSQKERQIYGVTRDLHLGKNK